MSSSSDIKKIMELAEDLYSSTRLDENYPDTSDGVLKLMLAISDIPKKKFDGAKYIPDPEVDGVWLIKLATPVDGFRAIIVYKDDEDFEMVRWQEDDEEDHVYKDGTSDTYLEDLDLTDVAEGVLNNDLSNESVETSGDGLWSDTAASVNLTKMNVDSHSPTFGELRIYFDTSTWDVDRDGLIYTDSAFLDGIKALLDAKGYTTDEIDYSEQGMQGDDYVSFDVGESFLLSCEEGDPVNEDDDTGMQNDYMEPQELVASEPQETGDTVTKTIVGHKDNETKMMQRELQKIEKYAAELSSMMDQIQDGDYPHWWQAKLVKAGDYISTIKHFLEAELDNMNQPSMPTDIDSVGFDLSYDDLLAPDMERF